MEYGIQFAETGTWCWPRCMPTAPISDRPHHHFFPEERREQLLMDLSLTHSRSDFKRLIRAKRGRAGFGMEIMLTSPLISDLIFKGDVARSGRDGALQPLGMKTFDQALFELYEAGLISMKTRCSRFQPAAAVVLGSALRSASS